MQEADTVAEQGLAVLCLIKSSCISLLNWLLSAMVACPASSGYTCFYVGPRMLDMVALMADMRNAVVAVVAIARGQQCVYHTESGNRHRDLPTDGPQLRCGPAQPGLTATSSPRL